jgi:integration host factor subunit beta
MPNPLKTEDLGAMTRSDLVNQLAERFGQLTHRDTEFAVKIIFDAMSAALSKGHRIEIRGFGSFSINRRPPRMGRNPRSGDQVPIPEKLVPHFKPGKALREAVDTKCLSTVLTAQSESASL